MYSGKLFSILGDSVSTLEGYSQPKDAEYYSGVHKLVSEVYKPEHTWWGKVINSLNGTLLVNNSISGSMVCKHSLSAFPSHSCSDERTSSLSDGDKTPDIIMVYMGTNDWGHGMSPYEKNGENGLTIFSVAYNTMLKKLKENYPKAEIWCFTLAVSGYKNGKEIKFPYEFGGYHIEEYCNVIRNCANENNCRIIDLYKFAEPFDTVDCFHPNASGMEKIANAVLVQV